MAQRYDFSIDQGTTLGKTVNVFLDGAVFNLTGYNARLQARERISDTTPVISLTSDPAAGLTIVAVDGEIAVEMTPEETEALTFDVAAYDLEIYTAGDAIVYRILEGYITLNKELTR